MRPTRLTSIHHQSAAASVRIPCPPSFDPESFCALPESMQREIAAATRKEFFFNSPSAKKDPMKAFPKLLDELNLLAIDRVTKARGRIAQFIVLTYIQEDLVEFLTGHFLSPSSYSKYASYLCLSHSSKTRRREEDYSSVKLDELAQNPHFGDLFASFSRCIFNSFSSIDPFR